MIEYLSYYYSQFIGLHLLSIVIGVCIGLSKGRAVSGLVWSLCFGFLGCIVVAVLPSRKPSPVLALQETQEAQLAIMRQQLEQMQAMQESMRRDRAEARKRFTPTGTQKLRS
jgi:hypothetical protein